MGKILLTISLILTCLLGFGQPTGANEPVLISGKSYNTYVFKPSTYADSVSKKYPVIIMLNGLGEDVNNLSTINSFGPNAMILGGWSGTQKLGDSTFEFITASLQKPSDGSAGPSTLIRQIDTVLTRYRVDTNRIYIMGLSAGGQKFFGMVCMDPITSYNYLKFTATVMWSSNTSIPGGTFDSLRQWTRIGGGIMYAVGNEDVGSNRRTAQSVIDAANAGRPDAGVGYTWTSPPWPTAGHGGWNYGFDSSYKDPTLNINTYEYLLGHTKQPYASAGQSVINITESTATLNGITRQYAWGYNGRGVTTTTWTKKSGGSATITNPNSDTTTVTGLTTGTYVFTLTSANASGGLSASKDVTVNVVANNQGAMFIKTRGRKLFITAD
ncbi:MAG TPA: hypothetical protein PL085_11500 [Agriterribacter sp.]|uniref:PKD domain-containing protein n=1 Tax=Agriterribacter sp. TaxID=2821509 RepID=UPI002CABD827|nr:hypothetical protein [Agriterribacter sp.]HRQ17694.1 hypothetical protein [Agriterribacter sp.]